MQYLTSVNTKILLPLVLMSAVMVTPAYANWFHDPNTGISLNVGSAPNPTPQSRQTVDYPLLSRLLNEQGTVGLKIFLTEQGTVSGAAVEDSSGFLRLDEAAVEYAMASWHYQPGIAGEPMPVAILVDVTFRLQ